MKTQPKSIFHILLFAAMLTSLCGAALNVTPARASGTIFVKPSGATSHSCDSWENACELSYALGTVAGPGDQLWVEQGTYTPIVGDPTDRTATFTLKNGVEIYGGFTGSETLLSERDPATNVTILSGEINDLGTISDNSYHVVTGGGTGSTAVLDGFTITEGNANDSPPNDHGAGLYNNASSPTLSMLKFINNSASDEGGGIYNIYGSDPTLTNVTFNGNKAQLGGGMHNWSSSPTLTDVTFDGNSATGSGGGMSNESSSNPALTNVTFTGNKGGQGGGMFNYLSSAPTLTNVIFSGNSAGFTLSGGGMYDLGSSPRLTNVTFSDNSAPGGAGGGINNDGSYSPILTNVTFHGNSADLGGGLYNQGSSDPILTNVTFSGNSAVTNGGAIYNNSSSPIIYNSIFWNDGQEFFDIGAFPTITDSIVQGLGCPSGGTCTHVIKTNPLLGALANNGGYTQTMALGTGSAAIDTGGVNSTCAAKDQRGINRPQGAACDMGAYEAPVTKTFKSAGGQDGWVLETSENGNHGGTMDSVSTTFRLGDDATKKQYRGVLSFATGAVLPDNAIIAQVTLKMKKSMVTGGGNPVTAFQGFMFDVKNGTFGTSALQTTDFQTAATHSYGPFLTTLSGGYYTIDVTSGAGDVNKLSTSSGLTQIRVRFKKDDDNNTKANYLSLFSGNVAASAPELSIQYYIP